MRERTDLTWDEVKELAKTKQPFSEKQKQTFKLKKTHTLLYTTVPSRDQETGAKMITDDDVIDGPVQEPGATKEKTPCQYGEMCYQTNPAHRAAFFHPTKPVEKPAEAKGKGKKAAAAPEKQQPVPCKWGAKCWQTNAAHLAKYSHDFSSTAKAAIPNEEIEDVEERAQSEEEDVPKETLRRQATVALTEKDVADAVAPPAPQAAANQPDALVQISLAELHRLTKIASEYGKMTAAKEVAAEPSLKKQKSTGRKK